MLGLGPPAWGQKLSPAMNQNGSASLKFADMTGTAKSTRASKPAVTENPGVLFTRTWSFQFGSVI